MTRFDYRKPVDAYTDDELRDSKQYKRLSKQLTHTDESELLAYIRRDIENRRKERLASELQKRVSKFVESLHELGYQGNNWAIKYDGEQYHLNSLSPPPPKRQPASPGINHQTKKPIPPRVGKSIARTKPVPAEKPHRLPAQTRSVAVKPASKSEKTKSVPAPIRLVRQVLQTEVLDRAVEQAMHMAQKGVPLPEADDDFDDAPEPKPAPRTRRSNIDVSSDLPVSQLDGFNDLPHEGTACPDITCTGVLEYVATVRNTNVPAFYCEDCDRHWVNPKKKNGGDRYIEMNEFVEYIKRQGEYRDEQSERETEYAARRAANDKWSLVTWEQIDAWRESQSLTIADVASMVGISASSVYGWKRGVTAPSLANQQKLQQLIEHVQA